jgi:two-component system cell cycle response regulator
MPTTITLEGIEENLAFFRKMYDAVRTVDPVRKRVMEYRECVAADTGEICHDYWENHRICDNCISIRAYQHNKSFIKLEQHPERIMLVTAIPVQTPNTSAPIILELLKNATDSMMLGCGNYNEGQLLHGFVSKVNDMVVRDALTNLYNRRFIDERLPADIVRTTLEGSPLSVIFMDIDNLKSINDTYGHPVGDEALKKVGHTIESSIRTQGDWAGRYGGDEFLVCLPKTGHDTAYQIAERIRCNVEKVFVETQDAHIPLTLSLGLHTMQQEKLTAEEITLLADRKMYNAKKAGKNRTAKST